MNNPGTIRNRNCASFGARRFVYATLLGIAAGLAPVLPAGAVLPEPSNLLFGYITISNHLVSVDRTEVVIEARRTSNGVAMASYRIGSEPRFGEAYFLEIPVETAAVTRNTNAAVAGSVLYIALKDDSGDLALITYQVVERGRFQRLDIVLGSGADDNGLPDAWELAYFSTAGQDPNADPDGDRLNNFQEYLAGTNPTVSDGPGLEIAAAGGQVFVSFFARRAEGPGYAGRARYYSLEATTNLSVAPWQPVANFTNIFGNNQTVLYTISAPDAVPKMFRSRQTLE